MVDMVSIWALLALGPPEFQAMASLSTNSLGCLTRQCFGLAQKTRAQYAGFHGGIPKAGWFIYIYIMKTDDLGGTTIYGNFHTPIWAYLMFQASIMA